MTSISFHFGAGVYTKLSKYLQLHAELQVWRQTQNYKQTILATNRLLPVGEPTDNSPDNFRRSTSGLKQGNTHYQTFNLFSAPVLGRGVLPLSKKMQLYAEAGVYASYLLKNDYSVEVEENIFEVTEYYKKTYDTVDETYYYKLQNISEPQFNKEANKYLDVLETKHLFKKWNYGHIVGAGVQMLFKNRWNVHFGMRYQQSWITMVNPKKRLISPLLEYYELVDDFRLHSLSANASLVIPIKYQVYDLKKPKK